MQHSSITGASLDCLPDQIMDDPQPTLAPSSNILPSPRPGVSTTKRVGGDIPLATLDSPLIKAKPQVMRCRCGHHAPYDASTDYGTVLCVTCAHLTHVACIPQCGGKLTVNHPYFNASAQAAFECHRCNVLYENPGLRSRIPSKIDRRKKMVTQ